MGRKLRFCMITTFYPPHNFGGDGIFVHRLSRELARRGHQVEVIHCTDAYRLLARREPVPDDDGDPNLIVHRLASPVGLLSPLATQQTGLPLFKSKPIKRILARGFDVIHFHNVSLVGGPRVLAYGQGIKLYTLHEYWLLCPVHTLFKYDQAPCTQPHCLPCTLFHRRPPQWWRYSSLLRESLKHVDVFIAPSEFIMRQHRQMGLALPIVHLPHFVPEPRDAEASGLGPLPAEPYFLFVGRLERTKGLHTLIPVFRRYRKARLLVVGSGRHEAQLRRLAAGCPNIEFLGYQSHQRLDALYRQAVALLVPSIWYEVVGQVIVEAFAHQTPVIARNIGGMPEVVRESGGGVLYDTDDQLPALLERLVEDPTARQTMGRRGYDAYRRNWTAEVHLERYLALIRDTAAACGRSLPADSGPGD